MQDQDLQRLVRGTKRRPSAPIGPGAILWPGGPWPRASWRIGDFNPALPLLQPRPTGAAGQPHDRSEVGRRLHDGAAVDCEILVVDDDPSILSTVMELLELEGLRARSAVNGAEALQCMADRLPALVLLDMRMPVLDGWGFAAAVRRQGLPVKILVMTAAQDAAAWAAEIGADGYIAKPFDVSDLLEAVYRLCEEE